MRFNPTNNTTYKRYTLCSVGRTCTRSEMDIEVTPVTAVMGTTFIAVDPSGIITAIPDFTHAGKWSVKLKLTLGSSPN